MGQSAIAGIETVADTDRYPVSAPGSSELRSAIDDLRTLLAGE